MQGKIAVDQDVLERALGGVEGSPLTRDFFLTQKPEDLLLAHYHLNVMEGIDGRNGQKRLLRILLLDELLEVVCFFPLVHSLHQTHHRQSHCQEPERYDHHQQNHYQNLVFPPRLNFSENEVLAGVDSIEVDFFCGSLIEVYILSPFVSGVLESPPDRRAEEEGSGIAFLLKAIESLDSEEGHFRVQVVHVESHEEND